ncbi:uncharacterized mitochondrial protein-like protein [Tanacetum coccineum]
MEVTYASASLDRKSTTGGCQFLGSRLISWQCKKQTIVANSTTEAEYVAAANCCGQVCINLEGEDSGQPTEPQHTPTTASPSHVEPILIVASSSQHKKIQKHRKTKRKATNISQSSGPTTLVADETVHKEKGDSVEKAATTATSLDADSGGSPRCQEAMGDTISQTRSERVSIPSYDSPFLGFNTPGSNEERIEFKELIDMCTKLSDMVLDLENVKNAQALGNSKRMHPNRGGMKLIKMKIFMVSRESETQGVWS